MNMKTNNYFLSAFFALFLQSASTRADGSIISIDDLPASVKAFIEQNFPQALISYAEQDGSINPIYEACLDDGTEIQFDNSGKWKKIDCNFRAIPNNLVPEYVANYVQINFSDAQIVKIEKEGQGYGVELNNGLDLKVSRGGAYISMDY